jgi:hypothetical protein
MKFNLSGRAALLRGLELGRRGSAALPLMVALVLFFAVGARAETTNTLSDAEIQGRQLARQLCEGQPPENFTNTGILQIRDGHGNRFEIPIKSKAIVTSNDWRIVYEASITNEMTTLLVIHAVGSANTYFYSTNLTTRVPVLGDIPTLGHLFRSSKISDGEIFLPFAHSDFWNCDLGLEFLHWPNQKFLPKPTNLKRGRAYTLLESTNPNPSTNGYSRVLSWIDKESNGILAAEAYDVNGKLLKEFEPKSFKKVDGQWQLQEMEIRNAQTGSRTRLEFDLKK